MTVTIVIVVRTIPERQISMYPIVLAIVLPPQFLWFKIQSGAVWHDNCRVASKPKGPGSGCGK